MKIINQVKQFIASNRKEINLGCRTVRTVISLAEPKTISQHFGVAIDALEKMTSNIDGNFGGISHIEFVKVNEMVPCRLELPISFYADILNALPHDGIGGMLHYEQYQIYHLDNIDIVTNPVMHSQIAGVSGKSGYTFLMCKKEYVAIVSKYFNDKLRQSSAQHISFTAREWGDESSQAEIKEISYPNKVKNTKYFSKIKNALDKNVNRSYLFYGPPGTGKTSIVSSIINEFNFRTIKIEDLSSLDINAIKTFIKIFKFDAVIIDDIDHHLIGGAESLSILEYLKDNVKCILITANMIKTINPALLRPGRVDEIIHVNTLDEEVVRSILGENEHLFEKVKDLPVAFINEIVDRIYLNGLDNIEKDIEEIRERANKFLGIKESEE